MNKLKEIDLLPVIKNSFSHNNYADLLSIEELPSGYGIADLVFYELEEDIVKNRYNQKIGSIDSLEILSILTKLSCVKDNIFNLTFLNSLSGGKIKRNKCNIVSYLINNGFILPVENSVELFQKGTEYKIGLKNTIAVEAKLSNWKRGLYQAFRYKQFANYSYLAVYKDNVHRAAKHLDLFIKYNVGLISVDKTSIKILFDPVREDVKSNHYLACAYENILKSVHTFVS